MKHFFSALLLSLLIIACKSTKPVSSVSYPLAGSWKLIYISGPTIANERYSNQKPTLTFSSEMKDQVSGNTGCNNFSGKIETEGDSISFAKPMAMTKMFCEGGGETIFLEILKNVNRYAVTNNTLSLMVDEIEVMRFARM
jgi:heat shock protein HslJ